ncbi:hypothetical protein SAMN04489722_1301 [Algibacter lectus]|uniref:hypothetical protein n=1 Tax=Algibacter lectus TaxID=221126 RepID=UPI0008E25348|nr:hypothetical protein [Algibacter lectus]SFD74945.1 hypothetical protein SAMN04489722_1301 [Algibacter lectus]
MSEINKNVIRDKLNYDILTHNTLKILVQKRIECEVYHKERKVDLAVSRDVLCKKMSLNKDELFVVTSILKENKEIKKYDNEFFGYFAIQKGIFSYGENKYLNKEKNKKRENIKYYIQILIPVITSLIALASIILNISQWKYNTKQTTSKSIINKESEQGHTRLNFLEEKTKNVDSVLRKNFYKPELKTN